MVFGLCMADGKADVNEADARGWTPLMHAAKSGNCAISEALLSLGERVDPTHCSHAGHSAVDIAMFYRHKDVYNLLTDFGTPTYRAVNLCIGLLFTAC